MKTCDCLCYISFNPYYALYPQLPISPQQYTVIAFLNSGSGGGVGKLILKDMQDLLGAGFVFDLRKCGKGNMPSDNVSS